MTSETHPFVTTSPGMELALLRQHAQRGLTFMVRMAKGAWAPMHDHPGGEETYVVRGTLRVTHRRDAAGHPLPDGVVSAGGYFYAAPGELHDGVAEEDDTLFFVVAAGGVVVGQRADEGARA